MSGHVGLRKPDPKFFRHILSEVGLAAEDVLLIDDNKAKIAAADAMGMRTMIFTDNRTVISALNNIMSNPVAKAWQYLYRHGKRFNSVTSSGVELEENYARIWILEATGRR